MELGDDSCEMENELEISITQSSPKWVLFAKKFVCKPNFYRIMPKLLNKRSFCKQSGWTRDSAALFIRVRCPNFIEIPSN